MKSLASLILCGVLGFAWVGDVKEPEPREVYHAFAYQVDGQTRNPRYAVEDLTVEVLAGGAVRRDNFYQDGALPREWRPRQEDYAGWDKGHLACSADHGRQESRDATFCLSNIVPQHAKANQVAIRKIEQVVRDMVTEKAVVYVVTFPLYLPDADGVIRVKTISARRIWVPTHIGKAVLVWRDGKYTLCRAWRVPNNETATADEQAYRVSVDEVEFDAGLDFYSWVPDQLEQELEARK